MTSSKTESKIALFGPQATHWTYESLATLQSAVLHDPKLKFLVDTLLNLSSLWPTISRHCGISSFDGEAKLQKLEEFAAGKELSDPENLSNTILAPLTVLAQVVDLSTNYALSDFEGTQGFCLGFLSAAALASSDNLLEFQRNASNCVRLAACIGIAVDVENGLHAPANQTTAVSVFWKSPSDRASLETTLDLFPEAYISCSTDEQALTITLPTYNIASFLSYLISAKIGTAMINLDGCYHHSRHVGVAATLKQLCRGNSELELPFAETMHLGLRSTADATRITTGALHDIAIDLILCKRAHWFQTVKLTMAEYPLAEKLKLVSLGKELCIPRSLLPSKRGFLNSKLNQDEEVAVVGMACRFPHADSLEDFWQLLTMGKTSISKLPAERFNPENISREPKLPTYWGNFLRRPDAFDHRFFGISGREAKSMDPQQRLALQVAYEALESSGYFSSVAENSDVGCYLGVGSVDYEDNVASDDANAFSAKGTLRAFITGRISHFFGWTGPSITFDTACSSSAVAIHTAARALIAGECSMALTGGVNVISSPNLYQNLAGASFLNPDGASRAFDANGNGYCRGEGAGILILKRLSKAIADGDTILGVIAGSAVNQNSNCSGITVPVSESQGFLYKKAMSIAKIDPKEVTYVEAHGTGTIVGDPIEYESVRTALTGPWRNQELFLGSVKDNIGHTEAASGAAGIIKTLMMMQHSLIPKQANFTRLNPLIKASSSDRITIPKENQPWNHKHHVALINNYGAAGSNAAIVVRSTTLDQRDTEQESTDTTPTSYPILLSAKSASNLQAYIDALESYLPKVEASFGALAYNIARKHNSSFTCRAAFTATDTQSLLALLNNPAARSEAVTTQAGVTPVVMCFGGQTGRIVKISKEFYDGCEVFRNHLNLCDEICQTLGLPSIFPGVFSDEMVEDLVSLHCMILASQVSCARSWIECGLQVDTLIGHSFGQLSALCVGDSISLKDAFRFVSGRARLIRETWGPECGSMLAVEGDGGEVKSAIDLLNSESGVQIEIACYNGPGSFVVAGDEASIEEAEEALKTFRLTRLKNSHAYHSYVADGILQDVRQLAKSIKIRSPRIHVETCSRDGNWLQFTAEELVQHTRQPVYFASAVDRVAARLPKAVWLEAGSASPIIAMTRRTMGRSSRSDVFIPTDFGSPGSITNLSNATGQLWKAGCAASFWVFHESLSKRFQNMNLPPYQFEQSSHWIDYKPKSEFPPGTSQHSISSKSRLVSRMNEGTKGEILFRVDTSNIVFDLAGRGHAVAGQSLCPASMYIELAVRCAMDIRVCGTVPHIEALTMSAPLGLGGDATVFLRLRETVQDTWEFAVISQPQDSDTGVRVEHAKGLLRLTHADDIFANSRLKLLRKFARNSRADQILNSASTTGISGAIVYKLFSDVVEYASYYRGVKSLSALGNKVVGFVNVPADQEFGLSDVICDPISLDNFLQVAGIHVNCLSGRKEAEVFMCTAVEEVIFSASFMNNRTSTRSWTVYSEYETITKGNIMNDIFVYDAITKELVVAIMGANFKSVLFKSLLRTLSRLNITAPVSSKVTSDHGSEDMVDSGYQTSQATPPEYEDKPTQGQVLDQLALDRVPVGNISNNLTRQVREMFSNIMEIPVEEIEPTSKLDDLGVDSLLVTEILSEIQKRFQVSITQAQFMECIDVLSLCRLIKPEEIGQNSQLGAKEVTKPRSSNIKLPNGYEHETLGKNIALALPAAGHLATVSQVCFVEAKLSYDKHANTTGFSNFCTEAFPLQSVLVTQYVVEAFESLGCSLQASECDDELPLVKYDPKHSKLIPQLYRILEAANLVRKDTDGKFVRTSAPVPTIPASTLYSEMLKKYPKHISETKLLATTAPRLADCLSGQADPIGLIFGSVAARGLLEDVYTNAPMFKTGTLLLAQYLSSVVEALEDNREIRILELGAGTGGTTKYLVERLAGLKTKRTFTYTFTDLSASLVAAAQRKFAQLPFMRYTVLNIEEDPSLQFLSQFDIVISTNCIHATKNLVHSATNIRKMLRPDGILCLVELTQNLFWFDLVFGLLEGWWLFDDGREHALADEQRWQMCLRSAGFEWVDWSDSTTQESDILRVISASPFRLPSAEVSKSDKTISSSLPVRETVVYKEVDGLQLRADLYYPSDKVDRNKSLPVALMIHGGGHIMLSRNDVRPEQTKILLKSGFIPISIDYRLCPEMTLLEGPMTDVADAMAWVRETLPGTLLSRPDIRADGNKVVCVGWSTGGTLAMSLAWTVIPKGIRPPEAILVFYCPTDYENAFWAKPNIPAGSQRGGDSYELDESIWSGIEDQPIASYNITPTKRAMGGWMAHSDPRSRLALYMNLHGRTLHVLLNGLDKKTRLEPAPDPAPSTVAEVSPLAQIRKGAYATPTFIIHPRQDDLIPWQQSQRTHAALLERGIDSSLRILEDVPHLFDVYGEHDGNQAAKAVVVEGYNFLCRYV